MIKICQRCDEPKPLTDFGPMAKAPDGFNYWCRPCCAIYHRERRQRLGLNKTWVPRVCDECGENFTPRRGDQRFCGWDCGHKFHRRKSDQPWNDRRRANYQKRRALKRGSAATEPISLELVRERDGNRCGLCQKFVNGKPYPHPLSASLDHIVPLSEGGAHDPTNVQLAHLRCNLRKGNRGGGEQLMLCG